MGNIRNRNLRFNVDDEEHQKAWDYLQNMNKKELGSQNQVILRAINEFFDRQCLLEEDPFLETRKKEEKFMDRIAEGVEQRISEQMPVLVSAYLSGLWGRWSMALGEKQVMLTQMWK